MYSLTWVEKISLCIDEGNGIVDGRRQSKTTMNPSASSGDVLRREEWISFFGHGDGVPAQKTEF